MQTDDEIRVLHVDDEPGFADMVVSFLDTTDERLEGTAARSAEEAWERLADADFDCIVSDYEMPETDGLEFLASVRESYPDLPFILFTGKGNEEIAGEAISKGVSDYLQKEAGTEQYTVLANRIRNLVRQYRAEERLSRHEEHEREGAQYHRELLEITSERTATAEEPTQRLLALAREFLGTDNGHLVRIDEASNSHHVVSVSGTDIVQTGVTDLSQTYCRRTIESDDIFEVHDAPAEGWTDDPAYERYGLGCYIGKKLLVEGELYGTVCFVSDSPRDEPFSQNERTFFDLVARSLNQLLERGRRRAQFRTLFEVTHDAVFLVDVLPGPEFTVRQVDSDYESLVGSESDELVGEPPVALSDDTGEGTGAERYRDCVRNEAPVEYETTLPGAPEGTRFRIGLSPVVEYGEVVQIVGTVRAITDGIPVANHG